MTGLAVRTPRLPRLSQSRSAERHVLRAVVRRRGARLPSALSRLADGGKLWLVGAAGLVAVGQHRAAAQGLAAVALSSPVEKLARRRSPTGADTDRLPTLRAPRPPLLRFPAPSGHTAAFAFTAAVGSELGVPLTVPLAGTVAVAAGLGRLTAARHRRSETAEGAILGLLSAAGSGPLVRGFVPASDSGIAPRRDPRRDYAQAGYRHPGSRAAGPGAVNT